MAGYVWWFVVGFGLLVAELLTGTFYLLVIAAALGMAGLSALFGAPFALQLVVAAVIGLGGSLWLRNTRWSHGLRQRAEDRVQNMDIGQTLQVDRWSAGGTARAQYRGSTWDVELAAGETPVAGEFVIREIHANRLIVAARPR